MNRNIQIIERDGKPEYAVVPYAEFERLCRLAEEAEDVRAYDMAMADEGEAVPHEVMRRLVEGESPLRVWREHRGLTQAVLAERAGVDKTYISQIEAGRKSASVKVMSRLGAALGVTLDDLISVEL
ncbi:MAG: helix-turn-helix transcriptional regulator [Chromatiaceae bacterium]|jgi:DNA-binding XRE family transcriptional regulator